MPVMDGLKMMREAKRKGLLSQIPVIAVTVEKEPRRVEQIIDSGVREIIAKPFEPAVIKNRVYYIIELAWH